MCCYLCKHPDSSSNSENTSETEEISQGNSSWVGHIAVALPVDEVELVTAWERDTDV